VVGVKRVLASVAMGWAIVCAVGSPASSAASCPNEDLRTGPSSVLPDCRAYELVTPPDSNGKMLEVPSTFTQGRPFDLFPTELASPVRPSFVYMTYAGSLNVPGRASGAFDTYAAERTGSGWVTNDRLSPPALGVSWNDPGGVSADHQYAFAFNTNNGNDNPEDLVMKADGDFELTGRGSLGTEPSVQGRYISEEGKHVIFTTGKLEGQSSWCKQAAGCPVRQLEPDAPPDGTGAVYDRAVDGPTRVISLLPGDKPQIAGEQAFYQGTSRNASSVAFEIGGVLYARIHNGEPASEETLEIGANDTYAGFSNDGQYLFYVTPGADGTIHRIDTESNSDVEVNPVGDGTIVNISADGSHVYFVSEQQLDGSKGTAGLPNMYVWSGGNPEYITTVAPSDLVRTSGSLEGMPNLSNWTRLVVAPMGNNSDGLERGPGADSSRTTPDGTVLVFESKAQLTSYDNAGHTEVYRFDDGDKSLVCASCNPSGSPAAGDARLQELQLVHVPILLHNLSDDGSRIFFETPEALVDEDLNGVNDIYEWEEGESRPALISSGTSPEYPVPTIVAVFAPLENLLVGITPDGADVFFAAKQALVQGAGEGGTEAIYDARVDGGFPAATVPKMCLEEQCRPPAGTARSAGALPASEGGVSTGNVKPHKKRCGRKGKKTNAKPRRHRCPRKHAGHARTSSAQPHRLPSRPATRGATAVPVAGTTESLEGQGTETVLARPSASPVASAGGIPAFGIEAFSAATSGPGAVSAGSHPDFVNTLEFTHFNEEGNPNKETTSASVEKVSLDLPAGLTGLPTATPTCDTGHFVSFGSCGLASQVGITKVKVGIPLYTPAVEPIYNLTPPHPHDEVARLGFIADLYPVFIDIHVRTAGDYGVTATVHGAPGLGTLIRAKTTLWGDPSSESHDRERLTPQEATICKSTACEYEEKHEGKAPTVTRTGLGFMTNPSACQEGVVGAQVTTYQLPGQTYSAPGPLAPITDCTGLPFAPSFEAEPTSHVAGAPTGLKTKLLLPQHLGAEERATATMREARVTLPAGMQVAAGAANWIGTCSDEEVGYQKEVDAACPDASKLGTATFVSPALSAPIEGTIYQRSPQPGHQLGLWLTSDALGLHIKLPGELEPDPQTGRLTAVFRDLPQVPVEAIDLDVWGGPRAPLQNPDHCGTFTTDFSFSPHSNDPVATGHSDMQITEGCNQGFNPSLKAGVTEPVAGKYSPLVFDLTLPDGNQGLRGFELKLPKGELAKIKGVPLCPDAAAAAASCPAGSRIGSIQATTGPGPEPFTLPAPGKAQPQIYLAGPYQGSPFSIVSEVPAQAGPFDLGTLAVRSGLAVEPETGIAIVKADPLPQFFEGVGIAYRNLHAVVDRPEFNLNPTDCREMAVTADVASTQGTVAHPTARFQVDGCKALKFKPKLSLKLRGGTKRASYPALSATLKARKGDANIAFASVALPHSEFLAQEHIGTICTRVQFAADTCPKGSVYGKAKAWTPLLDKPLSGPVYLRSSNHPLPDLVAKLGGQLEIDLVGRIDSIHGGIRATFESVPDAPVSKFVLQMKGGAKGLLTNSTDICRGSHRATVQFKAQNGRAATLRPQLASNGCGNKKLGKKHTKSH
jgi:hypothetical protein